MYLHVYAFSSQHSETIQAVYMYSTMLICSIVIVVFVIVLLFYALHMYRYKIYFKKIDTILLI